MAGRIAGIEVPEGFNLHTENTSHILLSSDEAFLNPVQEFNRDLSVACIRVWSEEMDSIKEARWRKAQEKKAKHKSISNQTGSYASLQKVSKFNEYCRTILFFDRQGRQDGDGRF